MAHIIEDRVLELSTSVGIGSFVTTGAAAGFRRLSDVCTISDTFPYYIEAIDANGVPTGEYEYGRATYSALNTFTRTLIYGSSNGGAATVFTAGSKNVGLAIAAPANSQTKTDWRSAIGAAASGAITSSGLTLATSHMLGRSTAGTGAVEEISLAATLELLAGVLGVKDASIIAAKLSGAQSGSAPIYGARAWCVFDGTLSGTNAPTAGGNVASVTRNGTGDYNITFTTAMSDANYAVTGTAQADTGGVEGNGNTTVTIKRESGALTASTARITTTTYAGNALNSKIVTVVFFR